MRLYKFLFIFLLLTVTLFANTQHKRQILVLHSYNPSMSWERNIDKAIDKVLSPQKNNYVLHREYMDTKRIFSKQYLQNLKKLYSLKYHNIHFDIILASDNNAFDFLRKNRNELFGKNVPVVFCGVNDFKKSDLNAVKHFTGAAELFDAKKTVEVAKKLMPKLKNLYIINDYLITGRAWEKTIKEQLKGSSLNITYAPNLSIKELQNAIAKLPKNSAVLLGVYYKDKNNRYFTYEKIGALLAKKAKQPIFCLLQFNVGNGIVGGSVIGGYYQGQAMAEIAKKILNGQNADTIPILEKGVTKLIFDYPSMQRYNLDIAELPQGTLILHKPISFYQKHKIVLWISAAIIFLLLFIIFLLLLSIKKRKYAEKLLYESQQKIKNLNKKLEREKTEVNILFETLFENVPIPLFYKDVHGIYLGTNKAFDTIYGFEPHSLIGKSVYDIAPAELAIKYEAEDKALFAAPNTMQVYEHLIQNHITKALHNVIFYKKCYFDADGNVQGLIGAIMDISDIKKEEKRLEEANEQFSMTLDNIIEGIIIHDTRVCIDANKTALNIYGVKDKETLIGKSLLEFVDVKDHAKIQTSMAEDFPEPYEVNIVKDNGSLLPALIKPFKLKTEEKSTIRIVSIIDLSEIKQKEHALQVARQKAEKATQAKSQFLANMTHEIRTPMNGILGMLYLLMQDNPKPKQLEYLKKIERSAKGLLYIINDILDYSKIEAGKLTLVEQNFDMHLLVNDVNDIISVIAEDKGIDFIIEYFPNHKDLFVYGDNFRIKQILLNLIGNAAKFTNKGYVKLSIRLINDNTIGFDINDTGIGISEEAQKSLFDSFTQADGSISREYGGTGLGLSITKQLVNLMGGTITLKSELGKGSTFSIRLPLHQVNSSDEADKAEPVQHEQTQREPDNSNVALLPISDEKKTVLVQKLRKCAQHHRAMVCKETIAEIFSYNLPTKEKNLFIKLHQMIERREYKLILEMLDEADNSSS